MIVKGSVSILIYLICSGILWSCSKDNVEPIPKIFYLESIRIEDKSNLDVFTDINPELEINLLFSEAVKADMLKQNITLRKSSGEQIELKFTTNNNSVLIKTAAPLTSFTTFQFEILRGLHATSGAQIQTGKVYTLISGMDLTDKFPRISDDELLTLVQHQTFKYFYDFAHPVSKMARERTASGNTVTTGGTGFGVMSMIVAVEREFISRLEALNNIQTIVSFLDTKATRYHGAFAHWIHGETGATMPFSTYDNGADLVETSLLFQGLLAARQYFNNSSSEETKLRADITKLWEGVEWNWFQKDNEKVLYWHWSENYGWQMNLKVLGWNECLITYVLAASSPTHSISKEVYDQGWTRNGQMVNNSTYYGHKLPLGQEMGGPLFFAHYSFLGLDPSRLQDQYANYWEQNRNHSLINYKYCVDNPKNYAGYSENNWGLTASDGNQGYSAHSPTNDRGVIAPTAALSSMPYTPEESMRALHFFYYKIGDKLWSEYGFRDAFNLSESWFNNQYIAINQGPIIIMIENHRTGLLWNLFMDIPEIQQGLIKLGFQVQDNNFLVYD